MRIQLVAAVALITLCMSGCGDGRLIITDAQVDDQAQFVIDLKDQLATAAAAKDAAETAADDAAIALSDIKAELDEALEAGASSEELTAIRARIEREQAELREQQAIAKLAEVEAATKQLTIQLEEQIATNMQLTQEKQRAEAKRLFGYIPQPFGDIAMALLGLGGTYYGTRMRRAGIDMARAIAGVAKSNGTNSVDFDRDRAALSKSMSPAAKGLVKAARANVPETTRRAAA